MKVRYGERKLPYPLHVLLGKLRLCGLTENDIMDFIRRVSNQFYNTTPTINELDLFATEFLLSKNPELQDNYITLTRYEELRRNRSGVNPFVLVIEGGSATGKSLISLPFVERLATTRILSTDSVRQVLRSQLNRSQYPELYCHTYQAHRYKQVGPTELHPIVRGYLAQSQLLEELLFTSVERYLHEGTTALVEGVHIVPGSLQRLGNSILEILVHPDVELHYDMFLLKQEASGLKTVSDRSDVRKEEFENTRRIQDFLLENASNNGIDIIQFTDYESAIKTIQTLILNRISRIVEGARR